MARVQGTILMVIIPMGINLMAMGRYQQYNNMNPEMQAAFNFINNRRYQDAINVLNRMNDRTAQWYYASSMGQRRRRQQCAGKGLCCAGSEYGPE